MDNKTESFETEFDLVAKQKQCQCAKVNHTATEATIKNNLDYIIRYLEGEPCDFGAPISKAEALRWAKESFDLLDKK